MPTPDRWARLHEEQNKPDQRQQGERDRDRILYAGAFRRLAGVTQVVNPVEGHVFHNRLTHTLEVAQIARRIAEKLLADPEQQALAKEYQIDPNVVEAAALAHDLGHPPFGHTGERQLDQLARDAGDPDGFEGNAQSFRILTRLAAHREGYVGLNLTRASLNAVLKYPRLRAHPMDSRRHEKFGAYRDDEEAFQFARDGSTGEHRSPEAQIMDYADDVAYSIHDLDDFFRAGLIPLDLLASREDVFDAFLKRWTETDRKPITEAEARTYKEPLWDLLERNTLGETYRGTFKQRAGLARRSSWFIQQFVFAVKLKEPDANGEVLDIDAATRLRIRFFNRLLWDFVIENPQLATQQHGQRHILKTLFGIYLDAVDRGDKSLVPPPFHEQLAALPSSGHADADRAARVRLTTDIVASFTDAQAAAMFRRLTGISSGSITDILDA